MKDSRQLIDVCPSDGVLEPHKVRIGSHDQIPHCVLCGQDVDRYVSVDALLDYYGDDEAGLRGAVWYAIDQLRKTAPTR